jgi:hypothetical protein
MEAAWQARTHVASNPVHLLAQLGTFLHAHLRAQRLAERRQAPGASLRVGAAHHDLGRHGRELEPLAQFGADPALADAGGAEHHRGARERVLQGLGVERLQLGNLALASQRGGGLAEHLAWGQIARLLAQEPRSFGITLEGKAAFQRGRGVDVETDGASQAALELVCGALQCLAGEIRARHRRVPARDHAPCLGVLGHHLQAGTRRTHQLVAARVLHAEHGHGLAASQLLDADVLAGHVHQRVAHGGVHRGVAEVVHHHRHHPSHAQAGPSGPRVGGLRLAIGRTPPAGGPHQRGRAFDLRGIVVDLANASQGPGKVAGVGVALLAVARERRVDHVIQLLGDIETNRGRVGWILEHQPPEQRDDVLSLEHVAPGQQSEQHRAEGVHVSARIDRLALGLLGGHVVGRAEDGAGLGHVAVGLRRPDHAEVDELDRGTLATNQEDVRQLHVAVDDAARMDGGQRLGRAPDHLHRILHAERLTPLALGQILAVEPLHGQEKPPVGPLPVRHVAHDVGMAEIAHHVDLAAEAHPLPVARRVPQELERHHLARGGVRALVDISRRTASHAGLDEKSLARLARIQGHLEVPGWLVVRPVASTRNITKPRVGPVHSACPTASSTLDAETTSLHARVAEVGPRRPACTRPKVRLGSHVPRDGTPVLAAPSPSSSPAQDPALSRL